jgi:hypothetical protein
MIEAPITAQVTASGSPLHPDAIATLGEGAASWRVRRGYYREADETEREV